MLHIQLINYGEVLYYSFIVLKVKSKCLNALVIQNYPKSFTIISNINVTI